MATSFDPGLCAEAIISVLSTNLAAQFNTLDTEYGDSITLRDVAHYYRAMPGVPDLYPCVGVWAAGQQETHDQGSGFQIRGHSFELKLWEIAIDDSTSLGLTVVEVLQKRLERSIRGVEEVLHSNRGLTVTGTNQARLDEIGPPIYLAFDSIGEGHNQRILRPASLPLRVIVK